MFYSEYGREQVTSSIQRGIISAHLPFSGIQNPHAFVMDATCNPGNSGSAVIDPEDGSVVGGQMGKEYLPPAELQQQMERQKNEQEREITKPPVSEE